MARVKQNSVPPMQRQLKQLISVGSATLGDLALLGIHSVTELREKKPYALYQQLIELTRKNHDICVVDVFAAAIAQARNPYLAKEKCQWWYWSKLRKAGKNLDQEIL